MKSCIRGFFVFKAYVYSLEIKILVGIRWLVNTKKGPTKFPITRVFQSSLRN